MLQQTIWMMVLLSAPVLVISTVVGLGISILQVVTQIQESTLTFVPKILASFAVLLLTASWMVHMMVSHTQQLFNALITFAQ